jgi:hypothetical protein
LAHAPDVNVSQSQLVVHRGNPDFPQDDGTIAHSSAPHFNEILFNREIGEFRVTESYCAGPHLWLVLVPMVARLDDFMLDPA